MILIQIGTSKNNYVDINNGWIVQQINNRLKDDIKVCVILKIKFEEIDIILSAGNCPESTSGGRKARPREKILFDLWNEIVLDGGDFKHQKLIQFLNKIRQYK